MPAICECIGNIEWIEEFIGSLTTRVNEPRQFFTMFEEVISIIKLID